MTLDKKNDTATCGIDEAGRGPVIGPMVISLVCVDPLLVNGLGVRDSKTLSRQRRESLYTKILSVASMVETRVLTAAELNQLMNSQTLNEIELELASSLAAMAEGEIVVDCFDVNESRASKRMSGLTGKNVKCVHKADRDYPAVSAASIVSKVIRDREVDRLADVYGEIGSGYPADPVTRRFIEESLRKGKDLSEIVRTHWKTYKEIERRVRSSSLF